MSSASLLTRLAMAADPQRNSRYSRRDHDLDVAVMNHLKRMLSTRQGDSLTCPDYGLIEISELLSDMTTHIGVLQRSIKQCITKYEPRLKNVQVRHVDTDPATQRLGFEITGQLVHPDGRREPFQMSSDLDASGNCSIQGV